MPSRVTIAFVTALALSACGDQPDDEPEGEVSAAEAKPKLVTGENGIRRPEGFLVEKLHEIPLQPYGSWISLAFDSKGSLLAGAEDGPLHRVRLTEEGKVGEVEVVKGVPGRVHGILEAFDSLYVVSHERNALVRCRDLNGDGVYDREESILPLDGDGEHGPHAVILTEDEEGLYLIAGNQCPIPIKAQFPSLPAPGGWIARLPPNASEIHIVAAGLRNAYDLVLNAQGDLFTCDSDAEQDAGLPWYRAPHFLHVASGADFGWREGGEKWPAHYADSLPPVAELGPASPAGLFSGNLTHFPKRYRNAVFVLDWTFGAIHAVHLTAKGASYASEPELFLSGANLPVTDAVIAKDGSLYFITGGRGVPSSLYRVRHKNPNSISREKPTGNHLRDQRLRLETFHQAPPSGIALREAWSRLGSPDRFVRHAARIALERQPVADWQDLFVKETGIRAVINAALALARKAPVHRRAALAKLSNLFYGSLNTENKLAYLRAFAIATKVEPEPPPELLAIITPQLSRAYPDGSDAVNMELSRVLSRLQAPGFVGKTLNQLEARRSAGAQVDRSLLISNPAYGDRFIRLSERPADPLGIHLAFMVSHVNEEYWRPGQMLRLARWLRKTVEQAPTGTSYHDVLLRLSQNVEGALPPNVKAELGPRQPTSPPPLALPTGPGRDWTLTEALEATEKLTHRDFTNGRRTYEAASCSACHIFNGAGTAFGPVLDGVGKRFSRDMLLEAIIHPSRIIPETYAIVTITEKSGGVFAGRVVSRDANGLFLAENPYDTNDLTRLETSGIEKEEPSPASPMPPALLNSLNEDELQNLIAYLLADGDSDDLRFH